MVSNGSKRKNRVCTITKGLCVDQSVTPPGCNYNKNGVVGPSQIMHVTTQSSNINFTVPTSSPNNISNNSNTNNANSANQRQAIAEDQPQQYQVQSHHSPAQHGSTTSCDTEDEIPASVISSVGTVNYQQSSHQILFVSTASRFAAPPNHEITPQNQQNRNSSASNAATVATPSSPIGKMVHSQQQINVSVASQQSAPRQHPKKRKFNPSELEEMAPTTTGPSIPPTQTSSSAPSATITHSNGNGTGNGVQTINTQPHSIEPVYTFATTVPAKMISLASVMEDGYKAATKPTSSPATTVAQPSLQQQSEPPIFPAVCLLVSTPPQSTKTEVPSAMDTWDLMEFCNHRVLAKQSDFYATGFIKASEIANSIVVEFDHPEGSRQIYYDVFGAGRYDVISDASPTANDVCI